MVTWSELMGYNLKTVPFKLPRRPETWDAYHHYGAIGLAEIRKTLLECDFLLRPNDFPYDIKSYNGQAVSHWVFWYNNDCNYTMSQAFDRCQSLFGHDDIIVIENIVANKSVPDLPHFHVFVLDSENK
jgi:hypothetical protein